MKLDKVHFNSADINHLFEEVVKLKAGRERDV